MIVLAIAPCERFFPEAIGSFSIDETGAHKTRLATHANTAIRARLMMMPHRLC